MKDIKGLYLYHSLEDSIVKKIEPIRKSVPVDIKKIIKKLGIEIVEDILPLDISGAIRRAGKDITIYFDTREPKTRQRFTLAHELAHYLLGHLDSGDGYISDNTLYRSGMTNRQERDANYLAAELLMPMEQIDKLLSSASYTLPTLAEKLEVSEAAVSIRLGIPL